MLLIDTARKALACVNPVVGSVGIIQKQRKRSREVS
jgi:hypothetical protein